LRLKADMRAPKHMRQLTTQQVFCQVKRRFHSRALKRQPLPWDLGISPPSSCSLGSFHIVERLLDDESLAWKYLTLSLKFLASQRNQTIILRPKIKNKKIREIGQSFWDKREYLLSKWIFLCSLGGHISPPSYVHYWV
jgi:hypothetical protein